jgi:hypothetical protein
MWLIEAALGGLLIASCLLMLLAIARRIQRRRRTCIKYRAYADERDTLARFRRIMGRSTKE